MVDVLTHIDSILNVKPDVSPPMPRVVRGVKRKLNSPILQGVKNVLCIDVVYKGRHTIIVLFGEVHTNPNLCHENEKVTDVILDVVIHTLLEIQPCILILETFRHLESKILNVMKNRIVKMAENKFPFERVRTCLNTPNDKQCVYRENSNALLFLRTFVGIIRYLALVKGEGSNVDMLSRRIFAMDIREDLGLIPPFQEYLGREPTVNEMRDSLSRLTRSAVEDRLPQIDADDMADAFQRHILDPFFALRDAAFNKPTVDKYRRLFVDLPDVVAVAQMLAVLTHAHSNDQELPVIFCYGGDSHLKNQERYLNVLSDALGFSFRVSQSPLRRSADNGGSCIRTSRV